MKAKTIILQFVLLLTEIEIDSQYAYQQRGADEDYETRIELDHINDPKDAMELATETLYNAFAKATSHRNVLKVEDLLQRLEMTIGSDESISLFTMVRIYESIDMDKDGEITNEEFVAFYADPISSPSKTLEMMHKLADYDKDGYVTKWEQFIALLVDNYGNHSPSELWKFVSESHREMDADIDNLVSKEEFMAFMIYNIQKSIFEQKHEELEK